MPLDHEEEPLAELMPLTRSSSSLLPLDLEDSSDFAEHCSQPRHEARGLSRSLLLEGREDGRRGGAGAAGDCARPSGSGCAALLQKAPLLRNISRQLIIATTVGLGVVAGAVIATNFSDDHGRIFSRRAVGSHTAAAAAAARVGAIEQGGFRRTSPESVVTDLAERVVHPFRFHVTKAELHQHRESKGSFFEAKTARAAQVAGYTDDTELDSSYLFLTDALGKQYAGPDEVSDDLPQESFPLLVEYRPSDKQVVAGVLEDREKAEWELVKQQSLSALREAVDRNRANGGAGASNNLLSALERLAPADTDAPGTKAAPSASDSGSKALAPVTPPHPHGPAEEARKREAMAKEAAAHSCSHYGCEVGFVASRKCQCNPECVAHHSCCLDYTAVCIDHSIPPLAGNCSVSNADCSATHCCTEVHDICFEQSEGGRAICAKACLAGDEGGQGTPIALPGQEPWTCKVLGKPRMVSLFCFAAMMSHGADLRLVKSQRRRGEGVFSCDDFLIFSDKEVDLGTGKDGRAIKSRAVASFDSRSRVAGALTSTWLNQKPFMEAWSQVAKMLRDSDHDFAAKVDPDTVFFPSQLRLKLRTIVPEMQRADHGHGVYFKNCEVPDAPGALQLYGSLEVLSSKAVRTYSERGAKCDVAQEDLMGEDMWMQKCLDMLGIGAVKEWNILADGYCSAYTWDPATCAFGKVAYHPLKTVDSWWRCWNEVTASYVPLGPLR